MTASNFGNRWSIYLAILLGVLMVLSGFFLMGLYAAEAFTSIGASDRSMLFWALPLAIIGCVLSLFGAALVWLARKAARGDRQLLSLLKGLLLAMAVVGGMLLVVGVFRAMGSFAGIAH